MTRYLISLLTTLCLSLFLISCDPQQDTPATQTVATAKPETQQPPRIPFQEPLQPDLYELPSGALATWRKFAAEKPTLLLYANHPLLVPLSAEERETALAVVQSGDGREIVRRGSANVPDPAFLPPQTVSVAIEAGLLSELVFVLPSKRPIEAFSLGDFQDRAFRSGFLTEQEAQALTLKDGVISGSLRGIPFRCVHPEARFEIQGPVLLHIDLGYFHDLYVNGVKTRPYDLIYNLSQTIRAKRYSAVATTLSFSNLEVGFALESRFVIRDLAEILRKPAQLNGQTPPAWSLRSEALYLVELFQKEASDNLIRQAAQANPDDAAAIFALSMLAFEGKNSQEGFRLLDTAVALDPGYGKAYMELAEQGLLLKEYDKSIELLHKAARLFPDDAFVRLQLAEILIRQGHGKEAQPILATLQGLPWSANYHPQVRATLSQMAEAAAERANPPRPAAEPQQNLK